MFLLVLFFLCTFSSINANAKPIGINLASIHDWSTELVFNDIFKRARGKWGSVHASNMGHDKRPVQTDRNGWVVRLFPNQWAVTYLFTDFRGHLPKGRYKCLYEGKGQIRFQGASTLSHGKGWIELKLKQDASFVTLIIAQTDPDNYIRNIRILPLNNKGKIITSTFRADFLNRWKGFKAIRFMDWMRSNESTVSRWSDRATTSYISQATKKGVALEYMIELANTLKISPWFCIPFKANDEYVRNFAEMVKKKLDPSLKCYIEYSNEVWNRVFPASRYAKSMGQNLGLPNDRFVGDRFYAQRSLQIFKIWESVFGGTGRFYRVLSSQAFWPDRDKKMLDWKDAYKHADALAIAPYFNIPHKSLKNGETPTLDEVFSLLTDDINNEIRPLIVKFHKMTEARKLKLIAYEGGQGLVARHNRVLRKLYAQANEDPRMYTLYKKYLNAWFQSGGGLINQYNSVQRYSKWGYWGALERYDQPISPTSKYAALVDELARH